MGPGICTVRRNAKGISPIIWIPLGVGIGAQIIPLLEEKELVKFVADNILFWYVLPEGLSCLAGWAFEIGLPVDPARAPFLPLSGIICLNLVKQFFLASRKDLEFLS